MSKNYALVLAVVLLTVVIGFAEVPKMMNYQGMLADAAGIPITGPRTIHFKLFGAESGGTALWTETHEVQVEEGLFDVILASITPFGDIDMDPESVYLEITIADDPPMMPRKQLVSVAFALQADNSDYLEDHPASDFVRSVNNVPPQDGNIDLVAGTNVTITTNPGNHRITIAAAGGGTADNLGNHTATQNIRLNDHWLSNDGGDEGISIGNSGNVLVPGDINSHGSIYANGNIQANATVIGVTNVMANGGYVRAGTPSSIYGVGDVAATDDLVADDDVIAGDRVISGGLMSCGDNMVVEHHLGVNMGGGYSTTYPLRVNGNTYTTGDLVVGNNIMCGDHVGIAFGGYNASYELYVSGNSYTTGSWQSSDIKFKKDVASIEGLLPRLKQLRGVSYNWRREEFPEKKFSDGQQYGLIAQEVEEIFPNLVKTDENGEKAIAYYQLIPMLLEAVKQQQKQIESMQQQLNNLAK